MNETQAIITAWNRLRHTGETAFLATVMQTEGSTYRRPGARMLFTRQGWIAGAISGGCLEADLLQTAWERTANGPVLVTYDSSANEDIVWGFGLGCNGVVHVLLERLTPSGVPGSSDVLTFLQTCLERRETGMIATVLRVEAPGGEPTGARVGDRLLLHENGKASGCLSHSSLRTDLIADMEEARQTGMNAVRRYETADAKLHIGLETVSPPRPLVIFGAGQDALPVVRLAKEMGWHVTVIDPRCTQLATERFAIADAVFGCTPDSICQKVILTPDTFTLLMTHNFLHDAELLAQMLDSPVCYVGVLGPRKRLHRLLEHLQSEGITPTEAQQERIHGPVGLDIGADNPEEIALSIVAELQAVATGRVGGALRERTAPLHAESRNTPPPDEKRTDERQTSYFTCPLS